MLLILAGAVLTLHATLQASPLLVEDLPPARVPCRVRVVEAVDETPVAKARVVADGRTFEVDSTGSVTLELAPGRQTLKATAEGYVDAHETIEVPASGMVEATLRLIPTALFRERIDVVASADAMDQAPATIPVQPSQVISVAGSAENVFRVLQTLPGVAGTDEFSGRLAVRGGGPDQNLTVMDSVEIHNPYRLFGLASAFNPETVERFQLTAGAFSARYGDRLSSLLVVENRDGSAKHALAGSAALALTDANLILEGRLPSQRGSWLLTGRRTYYDLVAERFTDQELPAFHDLQGRGLVRLGGGRTLTIVTLRSRENTDASYNLEAEAAEGAIFTRTRNDLTAATFHTPIGEHGWSRTIVSSYTNTDDCDFDASFRNEERRSNAPDESGFDTTEVALAWEGAVRDRALREELDFQLGSRHVLDTGFEAHRLRTSVTYTLLLDPELMGSGFESGGLLPEDLASARDDTRLGAWLQDRWQASRHLMLEGGLRVDRSSINERTSLSPRLAVTWSFTPQTRVRAALGLHTQSPGYEKLAQSDVFTDLSGAGPLPLESERARHVLLGLERDLPGGLLLRGEAYYKSFDRLIIGRLETPEETQARLATYDFPAELADSLPSEPALTTDPTNDGRGRARGFDVYVARRATSSMTRVSGWVSYTFGRAERTGYGRTYPFDYDRRHALSLVASIRATHTLELSATLRLAGGFPYTPVQGLRVAGTPDVDDLDADGNRDELVPERDVEGRLVYALDRGGAHNLNTARLPHYARLDARLTYVPGWGRGHVRFYLDAINVLNRDNAGFPSSTLEYDPTSDRPRLVESYAGGIPFLPSLGIHVTFGTREHIPSNASHGPRHRPPDSYSPPSTSSLIHD